MMLSTLFPTLIHFALAGAAAVMIFPNKWRDDILQKREIRGDAQAAALWYVTWVCSHRFLLCGDYMGGFKNQLQQLMFSSDFGELHIMQELSVNLYRRSEPEQGNRA